MSIKFQSKYGFTITALRVKNEYDPRPYSYYQLHVKDVKKYKINSIKTYTESEWNSLSAKEKELWANTLIDKVNAEITYRKNNSPLKPSDVRRSSSGVNTKLYRKDNDLYLGYITVMRGKTFEDTYYMAVPAIEGYSFTNTNNHFKKEIDAIKYVLKEVFDASKK